MDTPPEPKPDPNSLPPPQGPAAPTGVVLPQTAQERQWAMFCHLAAFIGYLVPVVGNICGPLVLWLMKKDMMSFVNQEGKESLNFQISISIYAIIAFFSLWACIGVVLLPAVIIFDIIMVIIASIEVSNGKPYRYPLCIRFVA